MFFLNLVYLPSCDWDGPAMATCCVFAEDDDDGAFVALLFVKHGWSTKWPGITVCQVAVVPAFVDPGWSVLVPCCPSKRCTHNF